jgi:pyruvate,water dikinase
VDPRLTPVALAAATEETLFGGKAVSLGAALRAGLPVPGGAALSAAFVDAVATGQAEALAALVNSAHLPDGSMAVRSSAVGEDSGDASFAGQHATRLNVTRATLVEAVRDVWSSGRTESALGYRARRGISAPPAVGVVVQLLVDPESAGVLFTRNPITGADEHVIEAAWGLGEVVVSSRIIPDYYRLGADGGLLEQVPGDKDVRIVRDANGGTSEVAVADDLRRVPCLRLPQLRQLHELVGRCRRVWSHELDLEFAFAADGTLYLLQSRPITAHGGHA